ncbi:hypothetical protein DMENIID0001_073720 [Sergentomyia squamirostris]
MKFILGLLILISLYKDSVEGSCLSYGHSCWGAHGKRSPARALPRLPPHINLPPRWAFLKIIPDKNLFEMQTKLDDNPMDRISVSKFYRSLSPNDVLEKDSESDNLARTNEDFDDTQNTKLFLNRDSRDSEETLPSDMDSSELTSKDLKFYKYADSGSSSKLFV